MTTVNSIKQNYAYSDDITLMETFKEMDNFRI